MSRPVVLEVNGTPLFRGVYDATGRDMAVPIVEHALLRAEARRQRGVSAAMQQEGMAGAGCHAA
jgi:hypothetical protein